MKFNHKFKLVNSSNAHREYKSENVNAHLDFLGESVLRVAIFNDKCENIPSFTVGVNKDLGKEFSFDDEKSGRNRLDLSGFEMTAPEVEVDGKIERFTLKNSIKIELNTDNFILSYYQNGARLFADRAPLAYNFGGEFGKGAYHYVTRESGENIFGLGDKSGKIDKSGKSYRIETSDSMGYDAEKSDPLYKHTPFYICRNSVGAYGIYYDTTDTAYVDLGREINNYYERFKFFKSSDDALIYYVFFGSPLEILRQYSRLCGKQAFPPKWSFDYCASTMAYTDAENSQEQMMNFLDKIKELDLSCSAFYLSSGYTSIGNLRLVFNWNYDKFPDPKGFVNEFKKNNIHIIPNIKPAFLQSHFMYDELAEKGYFIKNPDGTPYVTQFWDGLGSYLDFTNEDAQKFWQNQVTEKLLDLGIDATWNDNNEFDIKDEEALAHGFGESVSASRIRPTLTYLMVLSSYTAQRKMYKNKRPFLSTRSGNSGVRRFAQTWSGDNFTSFHDLRYCHYVGMTMSLSGFYFYGHDLGGFSGGMPSEELLLRWIQHGVFEPRLTIHSWNEDGTATMPWSYPQKIEAVREIFAERKTLIPYIYNCAYESVEQDLPIQAPPYIYFDDENIDVNTTAFMLGRNILAKCVLDEGKSGVNVYLPKGEIWYFENECLNGGITKYVEIPTDRAVPYFVKGGTVLPTDEGEYGFNKVEKLVFTVYPLKNGEFKSNFFTDDGESFNYLDNNCTKLEFTVNCTENAVEVTYKNLAKVELIPEIRLTPADSRTLIVKNK